MHSGSQSCATLGPWVWGNSNISFQKTSERKGKEREREEDDIHEFYELVLFCFLNTLLLLSMLNSLFTLPQVYHTLWTRLLRRLQVFISNAHPGLMNRGWVWTRRPRSPQPTLEMLHPSEGAPLRGWEHGASLVQLPVLPWDRLPFISLSPQGSQQQTTDGGRGERNIEEAKKGSFGCGGGEGACAFPATGQPQSVYPSLAGVFESRVST